MIWKQVIQGHGVHTQKRQELDVKYWAVIRDCVVRAIWLDQNSRIFIPTRPETIFL